jgi:hypothetical protein
LSGGVIHAAWVQAAPVWAAAIAAAVSLNQWQKQRRGERLLEHAEKALGSGREALRMIRAIRIRLVSIPQEEAGDTNRRRQYLRKKTEESIARAWDSWRIFQQNYSSARMFRPDHELETDVAGEFFDTLFDLQTTFEQIVQYEEGYFPDDLASRDELVALRKRFLGTPLADSPDEIGKRLAAAEDALEAELKPILQPRSARTKIRAFAARLLKSR